MKERLKMIFDRIDIFVVCIIFGSCLTVAEAFIGTWGGFVLLFIMTSLITEVCYTLRCNEKLEIELIEAKEKLKEAEKESDKIVENSRTIRFYVLLGMLWRKRWSCEHAKVNYCKHRITLRQLIDVMNHSDKMCDKISNKISELINDLNELDK